MKNRIINLALQIQQVAAPTFEESNRATLVQCLFNAIPSLSDIEVCPKGNVYARIKGRSSNCPVVVSAHLDTVFPLNTPLAVRLDGNKIYGPGIGDNSISVACLIALAEDLPYGNLDQDIWLVANTCEEGLGDLAGMKAVVDRFGSSPGLYLVLEGLGIDHLIHNGIGVKRYKITANSQGGHSWADFGTPSAIHQMAKLVDLISQIKVPKEPKTTFNVGKIIGGTSINTIAAQATIELDLRSKSAVALRHLDQQVLAIIGQMNRDGAQFSNEVIGERPSGILSSSHPALRHAQDLLKASGMEPILMAGSTDANVPLSKGYPSFVMGVTRGGGTHTVQEFIETDDIEIGYRNLREMVIWAGTDQVKPLPI